MTSEPELERTRRSFAQHVMRAASARNQRLEDAFATVRREDFVGDGPWPIFSGSGYALTPDDDPSHLYRDVLIGLVPERGLNNGQPSFHAAQLAKADPPLGAQIVHVGAGTGYYSAIMAELTGPIGRVTAIEYDGALAAKAKANLAARANVEVLHGDGAELCPPNAGLIYVNAGATGPAPAWLEALRDGGRLMLPLTAPMALPEGSSIPRGWGGVVFFIERRGEEFAVFDKAFVAVIPGDGFRKPEEEALLTAAFENGRVRDVTRLVRHGDVPETDCWVRTPNWSLLY